MNNCIHSCIISSFLKTILHMSSTTNYYRLILLVQFKLVTHMCSHMFGCFNSIHDRHTKVSQNHFVFQSFLHLFFKSINSFFAIDTKVDLMIDNAKWLKKKFHGWYTKLFIINNHNPIFLILFWYFLLAINIR